MSLLPEAKLLPPNVLELTPSLFSIAYRMLLPIGSTSFQVAMLLALKLDSVELNPTAEADRLARTVLEFSPIPKDKCVPDATVANLIQVLSVKRDLR